MIEVKRNTKFTTAAGHPAHVEAVKGDVARVAIRIGKRRISRAIMNVVDIREAILNVVDIRERMVPGSSVDPKPPEPRYSLATQTVFDARRLALLAGSLSTRASQLHDLAEECREEHEHATAAMLEQCAVKISADSMAIRQRAIRLVEQLGVRDRVVDHTLARLADRESTAIRQRSDRGSGR